MGVRAFPGGGNPLFWVCRRMPCSDADTSAAKKRKTTRQTLPKKAEAALLATDASGESMPVPDGSPSSNQPAPSLPRIGAAARRVSFNPAP